MTEFRTLAATRRHNASVAWLLTGTLAVLAVVLAVDGNWFWSGVALVTVAVVVSAPVHTRDPTTTMPAELVAVVVLPLVLQAAGVFLQTTPFVAIAGLALLVVLALDGLTSLEMAPRFAVLFVVVTTMAFAGAWAIAEFAADSLLGTELIVSQRELNVDLVSATVVGVVAGAVFGAYVRETDSIAPLHGTPLDGLLDAGRRFPGDRSARLERTAGDGGPVDGGGSQDDRDGEPTPETADVDDDVAESPAYRGVIRTLQVVLVGVVGYALVTVDGSLFVNSAVPLVLTTLPTIARLRYDYPTHARLALLIAVAATLHAVGALGPYQTVPWYDTLTHGVSSTLVAGVGYAIARGLELYTDRVSFSSRFRGVFLVLFVLAVGVLWELLEFGSGVVAGRLGDPVLSQYGVDDIVTDLVFNTVGAVAVALWGTGLFRRSAHGVADSVGGLLR